MNEKIIKSFLERDECINKKTISELASKWHPNVYAQVQAIFNVHRNSRGLLCSFVQSEETRFTIGKPIRVLKWQD